MKPQSPARIFLSDNREMQQSAQHRSFSTFNGAQTHTSLNYTVDQLNDEELAGGGSITHTMPQEGYLLILPITGDLTLEVQEADRKHISIGEISMLRLNKGTNFSLINPFPDDTINYLLVRVNADTDLAGSLVNSFALEANENQLIELINIPKLLEVRIGRFKGRSATVYLPGNNKNQVFAVVIAGAFELQNRLLQPRDALILATQDEVEFEALSEGAVLLLIAT